MFGYIKPQKSELFVREYEQYKGVYYSPCKQLGKNYGILSRFTLSYDCTFSAMLMMARPERPCKMTQGWRMPNPTKKCPFCERKYPELVFASALSAVMTYYKLRDDLKDPDLKSRLHAALLSPLSVCAYKKAARDYPGLKQAVADVTQLQEQTEQQESPPLDARAEPTAKMLFEVFSQLVEQDTPEFRILEQFGYFLGGWIYLMDAADDIPKDSKQNAFNPFIRNYGLMTENTQEQLQKAADRCNQVLNMTVSQTIAVFWLLDLGQFTPILNNIVCLGLPQTQKEFVLRMEKGKSNVGSV